MSRSGIDIGSFELYSNYQYGAYLTPAGANYRQFPVRVSIPVAASASRPDRPLELCDDRGGIVPARIRPFLHWPDGSVRAYEVWFHADLKLQERRSFTVRPAGGAPLPASVTGLALKEPALFRPAVILEDGTVLEAEAGFTAAPGHDSFVREEEQSFVLRHTGQDWFRGVLRRRTWDGYAGMELAVRLTNCALGDAQQVRGARLEFELPLGGAIRQTVQQYFHSRNRAMPEPRFVQSSNPFVLRANAGDVRVTDISQLDDDVSHYPAYERPGAVVVAPWLAAGDARATWLLLVDEACERFPKQWRIEGRRVIVDLYPEDAHPLEWRQGMSLFQRVHLARLPAQADGAALDNEAWAWRRPPLARIDAEVYRRAGWRIPFRHEPQRFPRTEKRLREAFRFHWYPGTFYWGDESDDVTLGAYLALPPDQKQRARPRNGEYDITAAAAKEYARTGRGEFLRMCRYAAEHLMYTDFVAFSEDPWKEGGVPAHSREHTRGAAYPSHMWIEGLTLYHQLTGDPYAVEVARRIGDFFLKYLRERQAIVKATAREGGWTLIALAALYDLTREPRYLEGIRQVVDFYLSLQPAQFFPENGTFMVAIAMVGLERVRELYREAEVRRFILGVVDWQMANRMTGEGLFNFHWDSESEGDCHVPAAMPEALNIAYRLSGDETYLRAALRQYQYWDQGTELHVMGGVRNQTDSRLAACTQLSFMGCLQSLAEKGWLDKLQFADPVS
jgi:hypothetical protein